MTTPSASSTMFPSDLPPGTHRDPPPQATTRARAFLWIGILIALLAIILALSGASVPQRAMHTMLAAVQSHPGMAFLVIVALMVAHNAVPVPAEAIAVAAGVILGPVTGGIAVWLGAMLGAGIAYWMARIWGRALVARILPASCIGRIDHLSASWTWQSCLAVRLVPIISFNLVNYGAGLAAIPWPTFLWTTSIGIVPVIAISVGIGAGLPGLGLDALMTVSAAVLLVCLGYKSLVSWRRRTRSRA